MSGATDGNIEQERGGVDAELGDVSTRVPCGTEELIVEAPGKGQEAVAGGEWGGLPHGVEAAGGDDAVSPRKKRHRRIDIHGIRQRWGRRRPGGDHQHLRVDAFHPGLLVGVRTKLGDFLLRAGVDRKSVG